MRSRVTEAVVPAEELKAPFPRIALPIQPPFLPMEAKSVEEIPPTEKDAGTSWLYEPKWDGFRCLAFRKGDDVLLQSKAGQPLARYFPELVEAVGALPQKQFVLDGEIVIAHDGLLSFDDLLLRIHPAESRIRKLAKETPASLLVFDLLVDERGRSQLEQTLEARRAALEEFFAKLPRGKHESIRLSPASRKRSEAERWMSEGTA